MELPIAGQTPMRKHFFPTAIQNLYPAGAKFDA
jgi:hypothetical protein